MKELNRNFAAGQTATRMSRLFILMFLVALISCVPDLSLRNESLHVPDKYMDDADTGSLAGIQWRQYFADTNLIALIDTALSNNQELNIFMRELEQSQNEIRIAKGEYLPFVDLGLGAGIDKVGRFTRFGALEENLEIQEGKQFPEPLPDYMIGAFASWEVDIWKKLRNAKKAALTRYLATVEGRNFLVTNLVSEIASAYFQLLALDRQLEIIRQNIQIQSDALQIVRIQKQSAKVTELAVKRFEAQLAGTQSMQFEIQQLIIEKQNEINFLLGRFPQAISRSRDAFNIGLPDNIQSGIPNELLQKRPDIRRAELELAAAKLDVQIARANFYPKLEIRAGMGYHAFNPQLVFQTPESMLYGIAGEMVAPLVNRNGIKALYFNANARQIQAAIDYEQTILNAYVEVVNELSNIQNLRENFQFKSYQVDRLNESIDISNNLFRSARADYIEILLTQEEALETKFELVEIKAEQLQARVGIYRALGGGWE